MTRINHMKFLLGRVRELRWKYDHILEDPRYRFNVFSMLREPHDEVYLHSRFLAELLDPKGDHFQKDAFLQLFLQQIGIDSFPSHDAKVSREYQNIDVFIAGDGYAVIIENKIHASDQDRQLERYYKAAIRRGFNQVAIVYLTLYGDEPSKQSLGNLVGRADEIVHCLSYEEDIHGWLDACVGSAARHPVVRETIVQYQRLIEMLTGHSFSRGYTMDVKDLLIDEENIALAVDISQALVEAKIEIQFTFWKELERRLRQEGFRIADGSASYQKYSRRKVERYYKRGKRYYGIMLKLDDLSDEMELLFFVVVGWNLHYSFTVLREGNRKIAQEAQFDHLAAICKEVDELFERTDYSLGWRFPSRKLNFKDFNDPNVFALADPAKRHRYIEDFVAEIKKAIQDFMAHFKDRGVAQEDWRIE